MDEWFLGKPSDGVVGPTGLMSGLKGFTPLYRREKAGDGLVAYVDSRVATDVLRDLTEVSRQQPTADPLLSVLVRIATGLEGLLQEARAPKAPVQQFPKREPDLYITTLNMREALSTIEKLPQEFRRKVAEGMREKGLLDALPGGPEVWAEVLGRGDVPKGYVEKEFVAKDPSGRAVVRFRELVKEPMLQVDVPDDQGPAPEAGQTAEGDKGGNTAGAGPAEDEEK